jgi:uncharacterized SAM-binding protein YcdF (DUF218 family)
MNESPVEARAPSPAATAAPSTRAGQRRRDRRGNGAESDAGRSMPDRSNPAIPNEITDQQDFERDHTPLGELQRPLSAWRRFLVFGVLFSALLVGYYVVSLFQVYSAGRSDDARPVDAIVVMGAAQYDGRPSPQLAARLDQVAELWPEGLAAVVVVTGGQQPGDRFTEAETSANYLIERGVPDAAIVREDQGTTSFQSLERVAALLGTDSGDERSVLIVTDPYHTLRSVLIAREVGLTAHGSPTQTSVVTGARSFERHVVEAGGVANGRLTGVDWLSDVTD